MTDLDADSADSKTDRRDYLLECFRAANEELLFRFKHRDQWIKLQLLGQAVLLALARNIKIGGVESPTSVSDALALAGLVSLVFFALYAVQDRIVSHLIRYIKDDISEWEEKLASVRTRIPNLEMSEGIAQYETSTIFLKFAAESVVFLIIPGVLVSYWVMSPSVPPVWHTVGIICNGVAGAITIVLLAWMCRYRWSLRRRKPEDEKQKQGHNEPMNPTAI